MNKIILNIDHNFLLDTTFVNNFKQKIDTEIIIKFISDFKNTKILREIVNEICNNININKVWKLRLTLIIDELNNNAIEYGTKKGDINIFKIKIKFQDDGKLYINCSVSDKGNGTKHKTAKDMILMRNTRKLKGFYKNNGIRGRGLFMIIEKLVDKLYFKDNEMGGLTVGIEKTIKE